MKKIEITEEDKEEFRKTINGQKKLLWLKIGVLIDILSTLAVCLINIFSYYLSNQIVYYILLYVFLVIVVIGGEFIGTYFGALEQYVIDKNMKKKEIDYLNN